MFNEASRIREEISLLLDAPVKVASDGDDNDMRMKFTSAESELIVRFRRDMFGSSYSLARINGIFEHDGVRKILDRAKERMAI